MVETEVGVKCTEKKKKSTSNSTGVCLVVEDAHLVPVFVNR